MDPGDFAGPRIAPPPWKLDGRHIQTPDPMGHGVAGVVATVATSPETVDDYGALLAAAPDLYRELANCRELLIRHREQADDPNQQEPSPEEITEAVEAAYDALEAAAGRQEWWELARQLEREAR